MHSIHRREVASLNIFFPLTMGGLYRMALHDAESRVRDPFFTPQAQAPAHSWPELSLDVFWQPLRNQDRLSAPYSSSSLVRCNTPQRLSRNIIVPSFAE